MCRKDKKCKYVWQYKNSDRCCFKDGYSHRYGFRYMPSFKKHMDGIQKLNTIINHSFCYHSVSYHIHYIMYH